MYGLDPTAGRHQIQGRHIFFTLLPQNCLFVCLGVWLFVFHSNLWDIRFTTVTVKALSNHDKRIICDLSKKMRIFICGFFKKATCGFLATETMKKIVRIKLNFQSTKTIRFLKLFIRDLKNNVSEFLYFCLYLDSCVRPLVWISWFLKILISINSSRMGYPTSDQQN